MTRADIVAAARTWIDTPYRHQASCKGAGTDCLGLVRGVWRDIIGDEPEPVPPYTPDWAEAMATETLLEAARRHLIEISIGEAERGDVLLFRRSIARSNLAKSRSFMPIGGGRCVRPGLCHGGVGGSRRRFGFQI